MEENTEIKETLESVKQNSSMKYVILGAVLLIVLGGVGYFVTKGTGAKTNPEEITETPTVKPAGPQSLTGQKFSDTQLAANAVLIAPGTLSEQAKTVTSGWQIKSRSLADGTTQVDLIPVGSEATEGDSKHSFNLKTGDQLYFVDLNPGDDSSGADNNKNDDIGIVVDANGIIQ